MNCPWPSCCDGLMFWKASGCQSYLKNRTRGWRPGRVQSQASKVQRGQARLPDQELTSVKRNPWIESFQTRQTSLKSQESGRGLATAGRLTCTRKQMIQAIFFDFNGVIIDDEPLQMAAYKEVLHEQGIELTESDYYSALGMDDKTFVRAAFERGKKALSDEAMKLVLA